MLRAFKVRSTCTALLIPRNTLRTYYKYVNKSLDQAGNLQESEKLEAVQMIDVMRHILSKNYTYCYK